MAVIFNEERFVQETMKRFDEQLNSPVARFIDRTPTFTTYYHINSDESTADQGFADVEALIGPRSPLKFERIKSFPIYGLEQIVAQMTETDIGIDVAYEGEAIILPGSIKPLPNDFFTIPYGADGFLFRVTGIEYDNIRPDNFYKITFKLDEINTERVYELDCKVLDKDKFTCVLNNIGSENKCIIQEDYKERLDAINNMYFDMVSLYLSLFYNERYNVLLWDRGDGFKLYDPYMSIFVNTHKLFNRERSLDYLHMEEDHVIDNKMKLKYEKTIYRFFERRDMNLIAPFYYNTILGVTKKESGFAKWYDESVHIVDIPLMKNAEGNYNIFDYKTMETIRLNCPTDSVYLNLIKKFLRNEEFIGIYDIDLTMNEELIGLCANEEMFFITPILLYIIKTVIKDFHKTGLASNK